MSNSWTKLFQNKARAHHSKFLTYWKNVGGKNK